jgi:hypothetical protein
MGLNGVGPNGPEWAVNLGPFRIYRSDSIIKMLKNNILLFGTGCANPSIDNGLLSPSHQEASKAPLIGAMGKTHQKPVA